MLDPTIRAVGPGSTTLSEAKASVEGAITSLRGLVERPALAKVDDVERAIWPLLLGLGRALLCLWLAHRVAAERAAIVSIRGEPAGMRTTTLGTRCGRVQFERPFWRAGKRKPQELLVDGRLGLGGGGFTLAVVAGITRLCAQMAFGSVRREWRELYGWAPSSRAVLRMVDAVGDVAEVFLETVPAPENDGEVIVGQVDCKGAPMITPAEYALRAQGRTAPAPTNRRLRRREKRLARARPRRTKGKKSKNAKMAVVGVIYTLKRLADGTWEGPINKRIIATFGTHEDLFVWFRREADKRGYGKKRMLFLADGARSIWAAQKRHLPKAEVCVDWYHIVEKLWVAGECVFREGSPELAGWVSTQKRCLRQGRVKELLGELERRLGAIPSTGPGNKGRRARLSKVIAHLTLHRRRLRYRAMRREGFEIGTGVVEGAVRNLVGMRLDGPGMRWGRERSERLLKLRCILLSEQWHDFVEALSGPLKPRLAAQPVPATTHEAIAQAA